MSILLAFLIGFAGHESEGTIKCWFDGDNDSAKLASYSVGGVLILIAFMIISYGTLPKKHWLTAVASMCASLIGVGTGVVTGYIVDGIK